MQHVSPERAGRHDAASSVAPIALQSGLPASLPRTAQHTRSTKRHPVRASTMPAGVRRRALVLVLASVSALALGGVAAAGNGGLLPPPPHSPNAERITDAYIFVLAFTAAIFVIVEGALLLFVIRYRRGRRPRTADGPQIHGATRLEIMWTIVPVRHPRRDRRLRLLQAARDRGRAGGGRGGRDDDRRRGTPVLLALPLSERRGLGRDDGRSGGHGRPRGRRLPGDRREPQLVGARVRRQDRRDPRASTNRDVVQGARGHLRRPLRRAVRDPARQDGRLR